MYRAVGGIGSVESSFIVQGKAVNTFNYSMNSEAGLTLIEVLVVLAVVSFGMVATAKFQGDLLHEGGTNKARVQALGYVVDKLEELRINHDGAGNGDEAGITGINASYDMAWNVAGFSGITDAQRHTAAIDWTDSKNRSQSMSLGSVVYPDRLYTDPSGAADCLSGGCSIEDAEPPSPPDVEITLGEPEVLAFDENWPGITNPTEDTTGDEGTDGDDKVYSPGHISDPFDLGDGDDILYISGQIKSELDAGDGDDQIETTGNVKGKVDLGDGNDAFKTHGHLQDDLTAGAGDDVVIISKHLQNKVYLGTGDDKLSIGQHLQNEAHGDAGNDYISVADNVASKIYMGNDDDFVVIGGSISDEVHGGNGDDSICLAGYSSSNWSGISDKLYDFENIKTSDGVIVKGSDDNFGTGCAYSANWSGAGSGYTYSYPISLTITPTAGLPQVSTITLVNNVSGSEISGVAPNGDDTYTIIVDINDMASFDLLTNDTFDADDLITEQTNQWVNREQSVTVTLKEKP